MLSPNSKKVLKYSQKAPDGKADLEALIEHFNWSFATTKSACSQLVELGYAEWTYNRQPILQTDILWGITLSEKGRCSTRYFWAAIGEFLLKSVAVPILVAFVTALITAIITAIITVKAAG